MFMAAAKALAALSPAKSLSQAKSDPAERLLPPVTALREVAVAVAIAVGQQAVPEGLSEGVTAGTVEAAVKAKMWTPRYRPYRRAEAKA